MRKLLVGSLFLVLMFVGCSTKYETVLDKDISVKVRSIWADVDYDSRRCPGLEERQELQALKTGDVEPLVSLMSLEPLEP